MKNQTVEGGGAVIQIQAEIGKGQFTRLPPAKTRVSKVSVEKFDSVSGRMEVEFTADLPDSVSIGDVRRRLNASYSVRPFEPGDETQFFGEAETDTPHMLAGDVEVMMVFG